MEPTDELAAAINRAVGDKLRGLRAQRRLTRAQVQKMTGLGRSTLQRFENGERSPDLHQLALILRALNMPMQEFVAWALQDVVK
jgi:transcriptional regulator with XRE-family HTH domain